MHPKKTDKEFFTNLWGFEKVKNKYKEKRKERKKIKKVVWGIKNNSWFYVICKKQ